MPGVGEAGAFAFGIARTGCLAGLRIATGTVFRTGATTGVVGAVRRTIVGCVRAPTVR